MNYHQGDFVVHQGFGVGTVVTIETMNTGDEACQYYRVNFEKTTMWVPVEDHPQGGVRPIIVKDDLDQYRAVLIRPPEPLDGDFRQRQLELEKRMDHGTYSGMCEVMRDLNAQLARRPLTQYEKNLLKHTSKAVISEWSIASGISQDEARTEIEGYISKGQEFSTST